MKFNHFRLFSFREYEMNPTFKVGNHYHFESTKFASKRLKFTIIRAQILPYIESIVFPIVLKIGAKTFKKFHNFTHDISPSFESKISPNSEPRIPIKNSRLKYSWI